MNILLINPPVRKMLRAEIPLEIDKEIGVFPSLGLLYIATYLKEKMPDQDIRIIDAKVDGLSFAGLEKAIRNKNPDLAGITVLTFSLLDVLDTVRLIKKVYPDTKICLGGPHISIFPVESLSLDGVDFVVMGEGEEVFLKLVENLAAKGDDHAFAGIEGLGFKDKQGRPRIGGAKQFIRELDTLPMPDRRLINYKNCYSLLGRDKFMATMQTSRGCPFRCIYCDQQSGKALRSRSSESIIAEIRGLWQLGIRDIFFLDDLFTLDRRRVMEFCDKLEEENLDVYFKISSRVDTVDKEMLRRLKESGCYRIHYGVESGSQKVLDRLGKGITLEKVRQAFVLTRAAGIDTFAYFMIGCPGETRKDVLDTINFSIELKPDYAHFSICTPYPDTRLYQMAKEEGVAASDYWKDFALRPGDDFATRFWTKDIAAKELVSLQNYANRRFYLRLPFLFKEITRKQSWPLRFKKARTALKILRRR